MTDFLINLLQSEAFWGFVHGAIVIVSTWLLTHVPFVGKLLSLIPIDISANKLTSWVVSFAVGIVGKLLAIGAISEHGWSAAILMSFGAALFSNGLYDIKKSKK